MTKKAQQMTLGPIHLCGSVPLPKAADVFRMASEKLGANITNIPDGETGEREQWIMWQRAIFADNPNFELVEHEGDYRNATARIPTTTWAQLKPGVVASDLDLGVLGYAKAAEASYNEFATLKQEGAIGESERFMVALPTPYNVINTSVAPQDRLTVEPLYEKAMAAEVKQIAETLPHDQVSIQWDVAHDMQTYEGSRQCYFAFHQDGIIARLVKMGALVPGDIPMGYHLCYGNFGGKHFVEPRDMAPMTSLSNRLCADSTRTIEWIHMPVPIERDDDPYFAPLNELKLRPETKLYLGLVHDQDGLEGCQRRKQTADKYISGYGIATECGFGRRPPETIGPLMELHTQLV